MGVDGERRVQRAAGGLVWRSDARGRRLAVIHRPKHRDWSLPKGRLDEGESFFQAAVREVEEETGCRVRPGRFAGAAIDRGRRRTKVVLYWHMHHCGGRFEPNDEVDRVEWLGPEEALERLDHPRDRRLLRRVLAALPRLRAQ
jgi:8-oxo-dGTP pyrophosphatase MutT (NUDIX family)